MDNTNDIYWLPIPGEEFLEASPDGVIRRVERLMDVSKRDALGRSIGNFRKVTKGGVVRPWVNNGYLVVSRMLDGVTTRRYVHRLVAMTFVPGFFDGATVDHIDGDRMNNHAHNLEWVSRAVNTSRQTAAGRGAGKGEKHPFAKLRDAEVPELFRLRAEGLSLSKIGGKFGVSGSLVHKIINGVRRASK